MEIASVLGKAVAIAQCAAIFALVGCSAVGTVTIGIDGAVVGALAQSGFIVADAEPGDRRITATAGYTPIGKSTAAINVQSRRGLLSENLAAHRALALDLPFIGSARSGFLVCGPPRASFVSKRNLPPWRGRGSQN